MHCANPPCEEVCPTKATTKRADGLVAIDYDLCIGCANCVMACPYDARSIVHAAHFSYGDKPLPSEAMRFDPARVAVSMKCTFCVDRIDEAAVTGRIPGVHPEVTPACVNSCISGAMEFGDIEDPESNVSRLLAGTQHFRMHEELGTEPGVFCRRRGWRPAAVHGTGRSRRLRHPCGNPSWFGPDRQRTYLRLV
jgi:phenylacetyl-CoA:acceptor oxidoreductase subunit 1